MLIEYLMCNMDVVSVTSKSATWTICFLQKFKKSFVYKIVDKTTKNPIKYIICFSLMLLKIFLAKSLACIHKKYAIFGFIAHILTVFTFKREIFDEEKFASCYRNYVHSSYFDYIYILRTLLRTLHGTCGVLFLGYILYECAKFNG